MNYKVKRTDDRGRCIVSTASLRWGDVVVEQEAYAAVLYDDQVMRCHYSLEAAEAHRCASKSFKNSNACKPVKLSSVYL